MRGCSRTISTSSPAAVTFTDEQKRQVAGLGQIATLKTNSLNPGRITVGEYCSLPENAAV